VPRQAIRVEQIVQITATTRLYDRHYRREALPLALFGILAQGNLPVQGQGESCYAVRTVQAGTPMTVKEMALPWRHGGAFFNQQIRTNQRVISFVTNSCYAVERIERRLDLQGSSAWVHYFIVNSTATLFAIEIPSQHSI
jgi:hypothetical protein